MFQNNLLLGIVQGRLSSPPSGELQFFPKDNWDQEFSLANNLSLSFIELIAERDHNKDNPIWSENGINQIKSLVKKNNLIIYSLCNDYVIDHSIKDQDVIDQNFKLIDSVNKLGAKKYILPLFERSEINFTNYKKFIEPLREISDYADKFNIEVCLETILNGKELKILIDKIDRKNIKVVFDTGNRVAHNHNLFEDIILLNNLITHVHIKDKNSNDENVILGTGLVNFDSIFSALKTINYKGAYTFETTRGKDPLKTAAYNKYLVEFFHSNQ